jgi:hypothetical protein
LLDINHQHIFYQNIEKQSSVFTHLTALIVAIYEEYYSSSAVSVASPSVSGLTTLTSSFSR